uniref:Uncharacterized protein n=1 Tax=viral metagenome TaxID=1070528 RepID=A0A6H2A0A6_9ZZZZ
MITGEYDQLRDLAEDNVCAADNGRLVVAWHKEQSCYYIKCGICGECKAMTRVMSLTEEHRAGNLPDGPVKDNVKKGIEKRAARLPTAPQAETFTGVPAADLGTGELLPREMVLALINYAGKYHLDPARGHVCLMYGRPYITIDGYLYHAAQDGRPYSIESRPLAPDEFGTYQIEAGSHAWISTVRFAGAGNYVTGLGIVTKEEMEAKSKRHPDQLAAPVVAAHPWQMAQKRAEWQALRRAFPIGEDKPGEEG